MKADHFVKDISMELDKSKFIEATHKIQCDISDLERNKLNNEKKNLTKIGNSNAYGNIVTFEMMKMLNKMIKYSQMHVPNEAGGHANEIMMGMCQADLLLAKRFLNKKLCIIVSKDSDFSVYVGSGSIQMKDFKYDTNKNMITNVELSIQNVALVKSITEKNIFFG